MFLKYVEKANSEVQKLNQKFKKNKLKGFLLRILQEIMRKDNTWNVICLVNETIVAETQFIILKIVGFIGT